MIRKRSFFAALFLTAVAVGTTTAGASASTAQPAIGRVACTSSTASIEWYPEGVFGPPETDCFAGLGTYNFNFDNASYVCSGSYYAGFLAAWWYYPGRNSCTPLDNPGYENVTEITLQ